MATPIQTVCGVEWSGLLGLSTFEVLNFPTPLKSSCNHSDIHTAKNSNTQALISDAQMHSQLLCCGLLHFEQVICVLRSHGACIQYVGH